MAERVIRLNTLQGLDERFYENRARQLNLAFRKYGIPFHAVCSTRKDKEGYVQVSWRRRGVSCDADFQNITYASEKVVYNYLWKNFRIRLKNLQRMNSDDIDRFKKKMEEYISRGKTRQGKFLSRKELDKELKKTETAKRREEAKKEREAKRQAAKEAKSGRTRTTTAKSGSTKRRTSTASGSKETKIVAVKEEPIIMAVPENTDVRVIDTGAEDDLDKLLAILS